MINAKMRNYDFFTLGAIDEYGLPQLSEKAGSIKMAIHTISQSIEDSVKYNTTSYLGLTLDEINDKYVISFGDKKLKVNYINPEGRYKQVFLGEM